MELNQGQKIRIIEFIKNINYSTFQCEMAHIKDRIKMDIGNYDNLLFVIDKMISRKEKKPSRVEKNKALLSFITEFTYSKLIKKELSSTELSKFIAMIDHILNENDVNITDDYDLLETLSNILILCHDIEYTNDNVTPLVIEDIRILLKEMGKSDELTTKYDNILKLINSHFKDPKEENIAIIKKELEELLIANQTTEKDHIQIVGELNKTLQNLEIAVADLACEQENLKKEKDELTSKIKEYKEKTKKLKEEIESLKMGQRNDQDIIKKLEKLIEDICQELLIGEINLYNKNKELNSLIEENKKLTNILVDYEVRVYEGSQKEKIKNQAIDFMILAIMHGPIKEEALKQKVIAEGLYIDEKEYYECLRKVRERINIITCNFDGQKDYYVENLKKSNSIHTLNLNTNGSKCINFLAVSCIHLDDKSDSAIIKPFDMLNEYATANGIPLILDAGDFFDFRKYYPDFYDKYLNGYTLVKNCIHLIPKADGVYHVLMGGNHDKYSYVYGIDAIKLFTDNREDFIFLGHDSARISINGKISKKTSFLLHHCQQRIDGPVYDTSFEPRKYTLYLTKQLKEYDIERKQHYMTIVGGSHMAGIYPSSGFITLPSLQYDRKCNGAMHFKMLLNDKSEIKDVIITSLLNNNDKLIPSSEYVYKK